MRATAGFPALFAPASLKLRFCRATKALALPFSGAFCAGLIEAAEATAMLPDRDPVFRRFLRRPH